ncbi:hypothetical protein V499_03821 [Pseudogymnoascus sp. VKM F-103]|nr:hypothetical protein V499_03821 [Pseudogymnoascus sp. VKM F-103]
MSSAVAELEAALQAMLSLKPPGVSGSRIATLTALCLANVQSESVLVQKLYTHMRKAPSTHKLGVLYVLDSVTRKWIEQAKANGQPITVSAQDGTYAAGVHRVTELLPVLMNDIIASAPDDQKDKIKKLVEIWVKGETFPADMLNSFKEKLNSKLADGFMISSTFLLQFLTTPGILVESTTPEGSPPADVGRSFPGAPPPATNAPNTSSILEALANMARQNTTAAAAPRAIPAPAPVQDNAYSMPQAQSNGAALNPTYPFPPSTQSVNVPAPAAASYGSLPQGQNNGVPNYPSNPNLPLGAGAPAPAAAAALNPDLQRQIMLIKTLSDAGVPQDQWGGIIAALTQTQAAAPVGSGVNVGGAPPAPYGAAPTNTWNPIESRDRGGPNEAVRSPQGRYRRRSRSQSPARGWNAPRDSPNSRRRDDNVGDYGRNSPAYGRDRHNEYRQRSPARRGRSPSPPRGFYDGRSGGTKWVEFDHSIPKGSIKVLSRTLFVGGVTCSDQELRRIFDQFGRVQTCIVNKDKRHAFVKMVSRQDAITAKEAMEGSRNPDSSLRTRWGVGFGPRDCSDYQTGVSIIPISKLTDADRKWMLSAEYGGSGGKPIESGMVVEEPDIEIGQGVSSKAISRRMQTDKGGQSGPKSGRDFDEDEHRRDRRRDDDRKDRGHGDAAAGQRDSDVPSWIRLPGQPATAAAATRQRLSDAEKNKYFKIVADPAALYSKTAVRKRKADEVVATEAARVEKANKERVTRSAAVGKLDREIGRGNGRLDALKEFVGSWEESNPVGSLGGTPRWRVFDFNERSGHLVYCEFHLLLSVKGFPDCKAAQNDAVEFDYLLRLGEHAHAPLSWNGLMLASDAAVNSITFSAFISAHHLKSSKAGEDTTVRCACAAPLGSPYMFAVACDDRPIFLLDASMNEAPSPPSSGESSILALTFLAESPHVLLTGKRSGKVPLVDLRVEGGGRSGIRHASSVARVAQVGENSVVVGGLQDKMCVYDLRFLKEKWRKEATRPVVRMWGHRNETRHDVDLAVDRGTGLVAAAQVEGGGGVRVFDVQSGAEIGYVAGGQPEGDYVRQVRFVERDKGVGLWVSRGEKILEYGFGSA